MGDLINDLSSATSVSIKNSKQFSYFQLPVMETPRLGLDGAKLGVTSFVSSR